MDISLLSRMIKELVMEHDNVSLPGLGMFVAELFPASFSDKGFVINPPYRRLYFRGRKGEDNLLVLFYARENDVDLPAAQKLIDSMVADIKKELDSKRVVEFPGLGKLRSTKERTLFFVADPELDIYPEGFGLRPLSLKSSEEVEQESSPSSENIVAENIVPENIEPEDISPVAEPDQEIVPDPQPQPQPSEAEAEPGTGSEVKDEGNSSVRKVLLWLGIPVAVAVVLLLVFVLFARLFPESRFIDSLLYSDEEIELLEWSRSADR